MKKVNNLSELVDLIGKETIDKCFNEYKMLKEGLFLLSVEEYNKYKEKITKQNWWWLRSQGNRSYEAMYVKSNSSVDCDEYYTHSGLGVRPALYIPNLKSLNLPIANIGNGDMVLYKNIHWIVLDEETGLCLSAYNLFVDIFDDKSNNYENSHIKRKLTEISKTLGLI